AWAEPLAADVADVGQCRDLVRTVVEKAGRLDVLVNNAGMSSPARGDLLDVAEADYDLVMATNLKGPFFLAQEAGRQIRRQREAGDAAKAYIVNVGSISTYTPSIHRSEYCLSKAGLGMLTQLLAHRLADLDVLVYEVRPGVVRTDMTRGAVEKYDRLIADGLTPIRRWGEPDDVGKAVAALVSGWFPFTTGEAINIDGGFHTRHL
ncbi:MAG: 3-ketoacyl-ACP reductase, partial [Planctomycetia bacterium]